MNQDGIKNPPAAKRGGFFKGAMTWVSCLMAPRKNERGEDRCGDPGIISKQRQNERKQGYGTG